MSETKELTLRQMIEAMKAQTIQSLVSIRADLHGLQEALDHKEKELRTNLGAVQAFDVALAALPPDA